MRRFGSIRVRLLVLIGLLLVIVLAGFGYIAWHREAASRIAAVDRELQERLNLLISAFRPAGGQRLDEVSEPRFSSRARELFTNSGGDPFYFIVLLRDGRVQARSEKAPEIPRPKSTGEDQIFRMHGDAREIMHFTPTGRCFLIGRSIQIERSAMRSDAASLALFGAGALFAGLALAWWIAARVTRPLVEVSRTAQQIAAGDLSQRIKITETKDELGEVAQVLNETFARLEAAYNRQKQFTADASHELRTPVSLILAHSQGALMQEQSPEDYREALTDISQAAKRMKALIESLLDLARFDEGSELIHREPCDLAVLALDCIALLRPLAEAKRIGLSTNLQPAVCLADRTRLSQVITNLLNNAIHFTPPDGIITIQTRQDAKACFSITDSGPGIAPEQLPYLFERFHRADASRARMTGGTGLGLAICKAIVEAYGGCIAVESRSDSGSTFRVSMPSRRCH
jgi:two-component system OmpR family sensor kinase